MRSSAVREAWEFYRDNCPGFKEPMRKEFHRLDEYVSSIESENAELREEIVRCADCKHGRSPQQGLPWMCIRNCCAHFTIDPDGFCAWGVARDGA